MRILKAEEEMAAGVRDADVYDVVLAATGSEERASAAESERIAAVMKRGETPDV